MIKGNLFLISFLLILFCHIPGYSQDGDETTKILFLGNSYFDWDFLPGMFENLCIHAGKKVHIDENIPSGKTLDYHASSLLTQMKISSEDWDFVVVIGSSRLIAYPDSFTVQPVYPALQTLKEKVRNNSQSTKLVYCLPWAYEDGMTWLEGWTDGYIEMQEKILRNTVRYSNEIGFMIAPVGMAWYRVLHESGYPLHYLHISDLSHPSVKGSYLMACTIYTTLFNESTEGNTYLADVPPEEVAYFQRTSAETVLNYPFLWGTGNTTDPQNESTVPATIYLFPPFPNPFTERTRIDFELKEAAEIQILLYNQEGSLLGILKQQEMPRGYHIFRFERDELPEGVYYYSLVKGEEIQTRKMIILD